MPYSVPGQGRTGHRRSYSHISPSPSFSATTTTGAFASLGALPRRHNTPPPPAKKPTFHFQDDDEDDSPDDIRINDEHDEDVLRLKLKPSAVPFPRTSPTHSPLTTHPPPLPPPRPPAIRTSSAILLSNGKPLKSSLKSSSSSPNIPFPPQSLVPSIMFPQLHPRHHHHYSQHFGHQRAASAPTTPNIAFSHDSTDDDDESTTSSSGCPSPPLPPPIPKTVHFPSQEEGGLATIKLFNRSAKPASVSRVGDDTETETETEGYNSTTTNAITSTGGWGRSWVSSAGSSGLRNPGAYPFPKFPTPPPTSSLAHIQTTATEEPNAFKTQVSIDPLNSSPVPQRGVQTAPGFVYLESLGFEETDTENELKLSGSVLVRNITYQKSVSVRFTLDDWHTTHEVHATHAKSLTAVPERFALFASGAGGDVVCASIDESTAASTSASSSSSPSSSLARSTWDRFVFTINLSDYHPRIEGRTMWLVVKYSMGGRMGGEVEQDWWDNNQSMNYRFGFLKTKVPVETPLAQTREYKRGVVVSAPSAYSPPGPKSTPSPPQLSSSASLPTTLPSSSSSLSLSSLPSPPTSQQREEQRLRQEALTASTLAHLKKLNLRNYAAPAAPSPTQRIHERTTSATSASTVSSNVTSVDSTPLHTPTQETGLHGGMGMGVHVHDPEVNVLEGGFGLGRSRAGSGSSLGSTTGWRVEGGHVATFFDPSSLSSGAVPVPVSGRRSPPRQFDMGMSPPFSSMMMDGMPGTSSKTPARAPSVASSTSTPTATSTPTPAFISTSPPLDKPLVENLLEDIKAKSVSIPAVPFPKRKSPSPPPSTSAVPSVPAHHAPARVTNGTGNGGTGGLGPLPLRRRKSGTGFSSGSPGTPGVGVGSPPRINTTPLSSGSESGSSTTVHDRDKDKLYQAFVKQWCFAQGP